MKILYVTFAAINSNTSANIRNKNLIKGLLGNEIDVDLVSIYTSPDNEYFDADYCGLPVTNEFILNKALLNEPEKNDASEASSGLVSKVVKKAYHSISIFDRTVVYFPKAKEIASQFQFAPYYDFVISSSDPKTAHVFTKKLLDEGIKYGEWIQYWGDPLALDITNKTIYPKKVLEKFEAKILQGADKIVYVSPITLVEHKKIYKKFADKMHFLPIPYAREKLYENHEGNKDRLRVAYFGDYASDIRNIVPLYNVICNESSKFSLSVSGNSDLKLGSKENIAISKRISSEEVALKEKESDVLVCLLNKSGTQIPGKLFHYSGTNKPILVITEKETSGAIQNYLGKYERFIICENNEESILRALNVIRDNGASYVPLEEFSSKNIASRLLSL